MLVIAQNNQKPTGCTEATVFGPFHVSNAPEFSQGADISNGAVGEPCVVSAVVRGISGEAVANAKVEVWQADADGFYDVQYPGNQGHRGRGVLHTDEKGELTFKTVLAEAYPIPTDGPVGRLLSALGRHPWRPAHLHFMIEAPGNEKLVTHVFRDDDQYLESDAVFGVRSSLVTRWNRHRAQGKEGGNTSGDHYTLDYEFVLNPCR